MELNKEYIGLLNDYRIEIQSRDYQNSESGYVKPVEQFLHWLMVRGISSIKQLEKDPQILLDYYDYVELERVNQRTGELLSVSMKTKLLSAVSILIEELVKKDKLKSAYFSTKRAREEYQYREPFTREEIQQFYDNCKDETDKIVLHLAYSFGLRRGAIHRLNIDDIMYAKGYLVVRNAKNNKRREVFNPDNILNDLKNYITSERQEIIVKNGKFSEPAVILNNNGNRLSGDGIAERFKAILKRSGVEKYGTLHNLRTSIITHLTEAGMPMEKVQQFAGHTIIDTVQVYAKRRQINNNYKLVA